MRISGPGSAAGGVAGRRGGAAGPAATGAFGLRGASDGSEAAGVTGAGPTLPLTSLDALVALQALPDTLERRRRGIRRGRELLDQLDEVRLALLDGELPLTTLQHLRAGVGAARDTTDDPGLDAILREVELRAAVELAKLEREGLDG